MKDKESLRNWPRGDKETQQLNAVWDPGPEKGH